MGILKNLQKFRVRVRKCSELRSSGYCGTGVQNSQKVPGRYKSAVSVPRVFVARAYRAYRSSGYGYEYPTELREVLCGVIPGVNIPGMVLCVPYRTQPCTFICPLLSADFCYAQLICYPLFLPPESACYRTFAEASRTGTGADVGGGSSATSFGATMGGHAGHSSTSSQGGKEGGGGKKAGNIFKSGGGGGVEGAAGSGAAAEGGSASNTPLVEYTMMMHPPLVVENLLPHAGDFELVDQVG